MTTERPAASKVLLVGHQLAQAGGAAAAIDHHMTAAPHIPAPKRNPQQFLLHDVGIVWMEPQEEHGIPGRLMLGGEDDRLAGDVFGPPHLEFDAGQEAQDRIPYSGPQRHAAAHYRAWQRQQQPQYQQQQRRPDEIKYINRAEPITFIGPPWVLFGTGG